MRDQVLQYIRERDLLHAGDRVAVAVSGGADSVALLRVLLELRAELGIVLFVAHFNHQLRGEESDTDERFVAELARQHGLPFSAGSGDVRQHAAARHIGLEHAARELRYRWLHQLVIREGLNAVATGHTLDDQTETVIMKFLRGAGTRGLASIRPVLMLEDWPVVRPLLQTSRLKIEQYLTSILQPWREDHTNLHTQHTRNRIRHELLPLLERDYNPNIRQVLSETADIALAEEDYWRDYTAGLASHWHQKVRRMRLQQGASDGFLLSDVAVQRRTLRHFLEWHGITVDFHHVEAVRVCVLRGGSAVSLPAGWQARRDGDWLELVAPTSAFEKPEIPRRWQFLLPIPGKCDVPQAGVTLRAVVVPAAAAAIEPPGTLLTLARIGGHLILRNWQPGDRFRPAHSASEEKLKRLFSEKHIPARQRATWPLALSGAQIVWVRGFPVAHDFAWVAGPGDALRIDILPAE